MRRKLKVMLTVLGAASGALMAAAKPLAYSYPMPWVGIVIGAVIGGVAGCWVGWCFFSKKEAE
ncbi:MAG: hypothetical protein Q7S83_01075 [bacterium]|nr:hypothetical protein [bacterium]